MMKKIITGLAIAAASLMVSIGTSSFSSLIGETAITAEAADKVLSMEEAADKVIKTAHKAYDQKKKLSITVTIECPNKKSVKKCKNKLRNVIAKEELEELISVKKLAEWSKLRLFTQYKKGSAKMLSDYNNGKLTIKVIQNGKDKRWKSFHENIIYGMQNMRELNEITEGMSEIDKAWRIAVWLMVDHETRYYGDRSKVATDEKDIAMNRAQGFCSDLSKMYMRYAGRMGIKVGWVRSNDHEINCIKIDGKVYYTDLQGVDVAHDAWQIMHNEDYNDENVDADYRVKYVPDPTGRWLKIPQDWAEAMESGLIAAYPWEVSEGEYCWLTEKQAKVKLPEEGFGKPSKWGYWWMRYVGSKCEI